MVKRNSPSYEINKGSIKYKTHEIKNNINEYVDVLTNKDDWLLVYFRTNIFCHSLAFSQRSHSFVCDDEC